LIEICDIADSDENKIKEQEGIWSTILPQSKLSADCEHYFEKELVSNIPASHVRLTIFPDGGISRMRLFGRIVV
jgi:allantoicase